jgi:hypothetical protein
VHAGLAAQVRVQVDQARKRSGVPQLDQAPAGGQRQVLTDGGDAVPLDAEHARRERGRARAIEEPRRLEHEHGP